MRISDWSSDVCSSDLRVLFEIGATARARAAEGWWRQVTTEAIRITGLREFQRNLKRLDSELPKALRMAFNTAADVVADDARQEIGRASGRERVCQYV